MERIVRGAGASGSTVVVTTQRPSGPVARIAEMLPLRAILPTASRLDHVAAGGEPGTWDPSAPAGRAVLAGRTVQFAMPPSEQASAAPTRPHPPVWQPRPAVTAIVARPAGPCAAALAAALPATRVLTLEGLASGIPWEELRERPTVLVGDPDGWQRQWSLFCRVRSEHDVVVSTGCAADFRVLAGRREVPPYSVDHPARAWLVPPIGEVSRVTLPGVAD